MGEIILITSGKGGSGKSTLAVNVGASLAMRGLKVLLIDADAGMRALDLMLGLSGKVVYDIADILAGRCEPVRAILESPVNQLHLLPAPQTTAVELIEPEGIKRLCRGLSHYYDFVIIDSPAGSGAGAVTAAAPAEKALIVTTADPVSVRDADRMASILFSLGVHDLRLVINRVVPKLVRKRALPDLDRVIDGAALQLIGVVPEDERVAACACVGRPAVPYPKGAAVAFRNIAGRLNGEEVPLMKL